MTDNIRKTHICSSLAILQDTAASKDTYLQIFHLLRMLISLRRMIICKMSMKFFKGIQLIFNSVYFSSHAFLL